MSCRRLYVVAGILAAFTSALGGAEEEPAVLKEADIRAILEAGQRVSLPDGVFLRVEAQLSRSVPADAALRAQAERKGVDFHAAPSSDQKMPQLMEENHEAQHKNERHDVAGGGPDMREDRQFHLPARSIEIQRCSQRTHDKTKD